MSARTAAVGTALLVAATGLAVQGPLRHGPRGGDPDAEGPSPPSSSSAVESAPVPLHVPAPAPASVPVPARRPSAESAPSVAAPRPPVEAAPPPTSTALARHVPWDRALATVGGRPILARDLVAPSGEALPVTDVLPLLVERAIRRALILEEARARGVELPPTAHAEIEVARRAMAAPGLTSILGRSPAEVDAELRDAAAMMLEAALLASLGHTPDVTAEDVARHRAAHPEDAVRPDAAIRSRLAQGKQAGYDDAASALVARLRARAGVEVHEVVIAVGTSDHN